jgi:hypothetical protein
MNNKMKNIVLLTIFILCAALIVIWLVTRSPKDEVYDYKGFVVNIRADGKDLILTTINASGQSEFTVKKSTRKELKNDSDVINIGDCIQLNTKKDSTVIKNCLVFGAYSSDGKIINVEGESAPYLLTATSTNSLRMYKLMLAEGDIPAMPTGTPVKIYYQYALNNNTTQVVADVLLPISDSTIPLTEGEIFHIEKVQNFTLAGSKAE